MSTTITYKGDTLTTAENQTRTLKTSGKYLEDDITVVDVTAASGPVKEKQVNFIDYDGTILYSYTKAEAEALTELPANPSHTGLVSQGWNWTLAQIKTQLTALPGGNVWIGQMYRTESGNTEIDVLFVDPARLSPILTICVNGTITVDWGDNTTADTVTGTSITTRLAVLHDYASTGDYTISIHVVSGSFRFYGSTTYQILRKNTTADSNKVYANCVKAVRFGTGVTMIGDGSFYYCFSLSYVTIPNTITTIYSNAFQDCRSLISITIPSGVTQIQGYQCNNCCSLTSIAIPYDVTSIGNGVFYGCSSLTSVTIPKTVTSIGQSVFYNCYSLKSMAIPSGVATIDTNAFNYCYALASISIPDTVQTIGQSAFYYCWALSSITIPSGVTTINLSAFGSCYSIPSITIPSTVTSIGNGAFSNNKGVAEYHIKPTTPPTLGTNVFSGIESDCKMYVPSASLDTYKTTTGWSTYASYMVGE